MLLEDFRTLHDVYVLLLLLNPYSHSMTTNEIRHDFKVVAGMINPHVPSLTTKSM
jgi:hypothetical protein